MLQTTSILLACLIASASTAAEPTKLDNPISVTYLEQHLEKTHPRLVFTPSILANLKARLKTDPILQNRYEAIQLNAKRIYEEPLLTREMVGRRLLHTSRAMLYRVNMLGLVYLVENDPQALQRINDELLAVSEFTDWNPSHYLDVAEMSLAVALALDWTHEDLPKATAEKAREALFHKGLDADGRGKTRIVDSSNNWNQVCNGGMIAAAIALAETHPELAADAIKRALDKMPKALAHYAPDGLYPEGPSYWAYGTGYSIITIAMLESAFGSDFGIAASPGFMESAVFRLLCNAPSGRYYNFADCGEFRSEGGDNLLAWFAAKTGDRTFFEKERFMLSPRKQGTLSRIDGVAMAWLSQYEEKTGTTMPTAWKGDGVNPIVIFTGGENDPHHYYFGGKGGAATTSHGNMDAGSFIFELDGVRWVIDPGMQGYHELEKTGFDLWGKKQDSERWTLLNKNNFGHSGLTLNHEFYVVDGFAPLIDFKNGAQSEAAFDLTALYGKNATEVTRRFIKDGPAALLIHDLIEPSPETKQITWQVITTSEVELIPGGALLHQDGKILRVENLSHPEVKMTVVSLDPPPLKLDQRIEGLKRLEINILPTAAVDGKIDLQVRLSKK